MKTLITNWIHSHLEYVTGSVTATGAMLVDTPHWIIQAILAVVLGFLGAMGAAGWKYLEKKLKRK